jgi:hypothetical protein
LATDANFVVVVELTVTVTVFGGGGGGYGCRFAGLGLVVIAWAGWCHRGRLVTHYFAAVALFRHGG